MPLYLNVVVYVRLDKLERLTEKLPGVSVFSTNQGF